MSTTPGLTAGKSITNNSGDTFIPCNKWDAEQMYAWGVKGATCGFAGCTTTPIVDPDGRGNTPWGFGSGVAGPESGYRWSFDWDKYVENGQTPQAMQDAMHATTSEGPWKRLRYNGSRVSFDTPGSASSALGIASKDASSLGVAVNTLGPTTDQTIEGGGPKAIRWAVGQLTALVPEYVWVKIEITDINLLLAGASDSCPRFNGDTFGGDAGGTDLGKDHVWRYYEPSPVSVNTCAMMGKPTNAAAVKPGQTYQHKVKMYNLGARDLTNVVVKDTLPSGVTFISSVPAQNSGPNPLVWNIGALPRGDSFEAVVTVKAIGTGAIDNTMCVTSTEYPNAACTTETVSNVPVLRQTKAVNDTSFARGATATYTIQIDNIGTATSVSPTRIEENMPAGLSYTGLVSATLNGASVTPTVTGSGTTPTFTFASGINAGSSLVLKFTALLSPTADGGTYCNYFTSYAGTTPLTTGSQACFTVGGGKIGDTIFRDWNGDGVRDAVEEGLPGVTVTLTGVTGGASCTSPCTTTTDANGQYSFVGLNAGTYNVTVPSPGAGGVPPAYTLTADPDGAALSTLFSKPLVADEVYLGADWGYKPGGTGSIGDKVFEDLNNNGVWDTGEPGIPNTFVRLRNANGQNVLTTQTDGSGNYSFTNLPTGLNYAVVSGLQGPTTYFGSDPFTLTTSNPIAVPNLAGIITTADFGFYRSLPATIGDQVYYDVDNSGGFNAGDTPLANVTVNLYASNGTTLLATTTSNASGIYSFPNLAPGTYVVKVDTLDGDIPSYLSAAVSQYNPVTVVAGQVDNGRDFRFTGSSTLGKTVDKAQLTTPGTLKFSISPSHTGPSLLVNATVTDTVPTGTSLAAQTRVARMRRRSPGVWGAIGGR